MSLSLKPEHLRRYKDLARLLVKYGRSDVVKEMGLDDLDATPNGNGAGAATVAEAEDLAADLEALGPTYIKLGQLLSSRADLLPQPYLQALSRLQDEVEPFDVADVVATIEDDLGLRVEVAFASFEPEPLAAASLGQVHRARLRGRQAGGGQDPASRHPGAGRRRTWPRCPSSPPSSTAAPSSASATGSSAMVEEFRRSHGPGARLPEEAANLDALSAQLDPRSTG